MKEVYVANTRTFELWEFHSLDRAVEFIGERRTTDERGVDRGDYHIDDMNEGE